MELIIPKQFNEAPPAHDTVRKINGNTVVMLSRQFETTKSKVNLTQHLIAFGIEGKKYFHSFKEDTILHKNEAIFLKKGLYLTTEKVLE